MPIYDNNGTTSSILGKIYDNNGTTSYELGKIYDNNGTTSYEVFTSAATVTDLINWYGWSTSGNTNGVNSWGENTVSYANGIQILSGASSAGMPAGEVNQNITVTNGHKYWLYFGYYAIGGMRVTTPFQTYNYANAYNTVSTVFTYSGSTGSQNVKAQNTSSDDTASDYCRLCSMNIVDLTSAFGSGSEPTASWCETNIGIFNGTKEVET